MSVRKKLNDEELLRYILSNFSYENGKVVRHDRKNSDGSYDKDGYLILKIKGRQVKAHRVVFALVNKRFPNGEIDHLNGIRDDNRVENLRECARIDNVLNRYAPINEETGYVGIYIDKTEGLKKKYSFNFRGKTFRFSSAEEAYSAKQELRKSAYGDYYNRFLEIKEER